MNKEGVAIKSVSKLYPQRDGSRRRVLNDIDLEVAQGERVMLVGASGCGKSTLLRLIAGLELPSEGTIDVAGTLVTGPGVNRGVVFQQSTLFPWLTVWQNVTFSRQLRVNINVDDSQVAQAVYRSNALMNVMGMDHVRDAYPNQLSGGMQQRANIARALVSSPAVLLMDEPFGALDAQTRETMHDLVLHLFNAEMTTVVFVTHDVEEAVYLGDKVVVLGSNPGHIDSIYDIPFGRERSHEIKFIPEFVSIRNEILNRIRATTEVRTNQDVLRKMTEFK